MAIMANDEWMWVNESEWKSEWEQTWVNKSEWSEEVQILHKSTGEG